MARQHCIAASLVSAEEFRHAHADVMSIILLSSSDDVSLEKCSFSSRISENSSYHQWTDAAATTALNDQNDVKLLLVVDVGTTGLAHPRYRCSSVRP